MNKGIIMSQAITSDLETCFRRIAENMANANAKLNDLDRKIKEIEEKLNKAKDDSVFNASMVSELKENFIQKQEFGEFISRLTESFRELSLLPADSREAKKGKM